MSSIRMNVLCEEMLFRRIHRDVISRVTFTFLFRLFLWPSVMVWGLMASAWFIPCFDSLRREKALFRLLDWHDYTHKPVSPCICCRVCLDRTRQEESIILFRGLSLSRDADTLYKWVCIPQFSWEKEEDATTSLFPSTYSVGYSVLPEGTSFYTSVMIVYLLLLFCLQLFIQPSFLAAVLPGFSKRIETK